MAEQNDAIVALSAAVLRSNHMEIEALNLEALVADEGPAGVERVVHGVVMSEVREGAFGMEILGAIIVPVVVDAVRKFWTAYSGEMVEKLGASAAELTAVKLRVWFSAAPQEELKVFADRLSEQIRNVGAQRRMRPEDIEALVAATTPESLGTALAAE